MLNDTVSESVKTSIAYEFGSGLGCLFKAISSAQKASLNNLTSLSLNLHVDTNLNLCVIEAGAAGAGYVEIPFTNSKQSHPF